MSLQSVRGTHDLLPDEALKHRWVIDKARHVASLYGFKEMTTPIFEFSDVFSRTLGDASDIVSKEMYTFLDKGGDSITLRPEGTAGIARAYISEGLQQIVPFKVFYHGPMFRYERPQKGRQRQFHQLGVEFLGIPGPTADIECLALAAQTLEALKVGTRARLEINSLGDHESRERYVAQLKSYLSAHVSSLSPDSQRRLQQNPLRILDSKDEGDQKLLENAPPIKESLNSQSQDHLAQVEEGLKNLKISYSINPRLVRGLDYYTHTVFEFRSQDLGAQDAILSGGRYDDLIQTMGGPKTPGVGWAAGIERLVLLLQEAPAHPRPVVIVALGDRAERAAPGLAQHLRQHDVATELTYSGNMSKRMKKAANLNAWCVMIVGDNELDQNQVALKFLDSGEQVTCPMESLIEKLKPT